MRTSPKIAFYIAFISTLLGPLLLPKGHVLFFAPYLVTAFYHNSRFSIVWKAVGCGVILDFFSSSQLFGLLPINFCLVSFILYPQKRNFFQDKLSTLPIMTVLFSLLSTLTSLILLPFFGQSYPLSLEWISTDLLGMSVLDGTYALVLFALPFKITYKLSRTKLFRRKRS